jgi:hypothetical protein
MSASGPTTVVARKEKAARRRLDIRDLDFNQVGSAALFRRYAMKPTLAKPKSSIAHVDGSGTAEDIVPLTKGSV